MMACECVERVNEHLEQFNTVLRRASMMNMTTGNIRHALVVATERRSLAGKRQKVKTVLATYCPFCGKRADGKEE